MTPPVYPYFNSYIKNLYILVFQMDRQTDGDINSGGLFYPIGSSRYTRCAWSGVTFFRYLRKVPPAHSRFACLVQELEGVHRLILCLKQIGPP
jgi:hypothetical protein